MSKVIFVALAILAACVSAQDPPPGWLSYATATCPAGTRITKWEGKWKVGPTPQQSFAFYSPWIGMDTTDNLNLLQPVNPWLGSSWNFYTEYFQWQPTSNSNSQQMSTSAGHILHGSVTWNGDQTYTILQRDTTSGTSSSQTQKVQRGSDGQHKNYTILYVVYEKVASCGDYPPNGEITFFDLYAECNGSPLTPSWTTSYVEDVCDFRAHVVNSTAIKMTWDTSSSKTYTKERMEAVNGPRGSLNAKKIFKKRA